MRIGAGRNRGRVLAVPPGAVVRPTADRVRESLFDVLAGGRVFPDFRIEGASVLDLFAGSGAIGLEALSRGAARATFVERDPRALSVLRRNVAALGMEDVATILARDAADPGPAPGAFDLAYLDPPYRSGLAAPALRGVMAGWAAPGAAVAVELAAREPFVAPDGCEVRDERVYGAARLLFLRVSSSTPS